MGNQIIKQPNGLFGIFSTIVGDWIAIDFTEKNIIQYCGEEAKKREEDRVKQILNQLGNEGSPYQQFTLSYEEAEEIRKSKKG